MSKEYEESSGSTTKLAAPYESSSLLSWKVMLSYLVGERRQRVAIGSYMFLVGSARRAGLSIIKRSEFLFLLFVRELNAYADLCILSY